MDDVMDSVDRLKESFLCAAAFAGKASDCESLIELGADINWKNPDGDTPLISAAKGGHTDVIESLLAHGANVNAQGKDSYAPLHICSRRGDLNSVNVLLNANASTTLKTKDGKTALDIAKLNRHESIYAALMRSRQLPRQFPPTSTNSSNNYSLNTRVTPNRVELQPVEASSSSSRPNSNQSRKRNAINRIVNHVSSTPGTGENVDNGQSLQQLNESSRRNTFGSRYEIADPSKGGQIKDLEDLATIHALQSILDQEMETRKTVESKLEIFKDQNRELLHEFASLTKQLTDLQKENSNLEFFNKRILGERDALESITWEECDDLERKLKIALRNVEQKKESLVKARTEGDQEQRLCVICQENEKSVVFFPCRHLCVCSFCSNHDALIQCPLCRQNITQKVTVFS